MQRHPLPGWRRLWRHSYRIGLRWLVREARHGWPGARAGLTRLLVPLDPWRYYEMGRIAEQTFSGRCLDISSPKLLPSLLRHEGRGQWVCVDLFTKEIESWRVLDPRLTLDVEDATRLPYSADTFDAIVCLSVLEHIGPGGDDAALQEMWRVLRPGGVLHLTTDVALVGRDVLLENRIYGEASDPAASGGYFFKRDYGIDELNALLGQKPWHERHREYAVQIDPSLEQNFYAWRPWSYLYGPFLRLRCPQNFDVSASSSIIGEERHGVVYLRLEKPTTGDRSGSAGA